MKGFQFRKSFQLLPGLRLNISKKGASLSIGPDGAHITTGTAGTNLYLDLPGSGAYYRKKLDVGRLTSNKSETKDTGKDTSSSEQDEHLSVGFWDRLTKPPEELDLIDALRAFSEGDEVKAYEIAQRATHLADGAFLAGVLAINNQRYAQAVEYLKKALEKKDQLGQHFDKYEVDARVELPVTDEVSAEIMPDERGVLLALAEAYQRGDVDELAIETMQQLQKHDPDDLVIRLALAELLNDRYPDAPQVQQRIIELAEGVHNASPIHAALMFYRARALRKLGMYEGADDTLKKATRRRKDYPKDLLLALNYERAMIYEATGKTKEAQKEFQKVYAEAPAYEDVAARLGL